MDFECDYWGCTACDTAGECMYYDWEGWEDFTDALTYDIEYYEDMMEYYAGVYGYEGVDFTCNPDGCEACDDTGCMWMSWEDWEETFYAAYYYEYYEGVMEYYAGLYGYEG